MSAKKLIACLVLLLSIESAAQILLPSHSVRIDSSFHFSNKNNAVKSLNFRSHQKSPMVVVNDFIYLAYYNVDRKICLARLNLKDPDSNYEIVVFDDFIQEKNDAHRTINIGYSLADGTLHLAFDNHDSQLNYRKSLSNILDPPAKEWDQSLFGSVLNGFESDEQALDNLTYPSFFADKNGDLMVLYRIGKAGNGNWYLSNYNGVTQSWEKSRLVISNHGLYEYQNGLISSSRCAYPNGISFDAQNNMHVTFTWKEEWWEANHDLCYIISEDRGNTWQSYDLFTSDSGEIEPQESVDINTPDLTVFEVPVTFGMHNQTAQTLDHAGKLHLITMHRNIAGDSLIANYEETSYVYYTNANGEWSATRLDFKGSRPEMWYDQNLNQLFLSSVDYGSSENSTDKYYVYVKGDCNSCWSRIYESDSKYFSEATLTGYINESGEGFLFLAGQQLTGTANSPIDLITLEYDSTSSQLLGLSYLQNFNFSIYPNPAKNRLTINDLPEQMKSIQIIDLNGQVVLDQKNQREVLNLNLSDLASGVYVVRLTLTSGITLSKKLVLSK